MIRHYLIAALRNMAASKLLSAISILGLAIGLTTAILAGLLIRNEITYDHFLLGYARTYVLVARSNFPGETYTSASDVRMADLLQLNVPEIENVTRLNDATLPLRHGQITSREPIKWADASLFAVLPFPGLHGDLADDLARPDGIVLTRATAEKYFGRDDVVGQTLDVDGHAMQVRAVIADLPLHATSFQSDAWSAADGANLPGAGPPVAAFVSSLAAFSPKPPTLKKGQIHFEGNIYLRLRPGASVAAVDKATSRLYGGLAPVAAGAFVMRIDRAHLSDDLNPGMEAKLAVSAAIGLLTLFIAVANFINLAVARSARRQRDVGVRKACGAGRNDLMRQFLGEALVSVAMASVIAMALVEWLLPIVNAYLQSGASFDWQNPLLALCLLLGLLGVALLAGAYPAFILSGFHPTRVFKGWFISAVGLVRNILVAAQFAILVTLTIAAAVVYQQRDYAAREALRANIDQMLIVQAPCSPALLNNIQALAGVKGAACAGSEFVDDVVLQARQYKGKLLILNVARVDFGVFALYEITPIAGTLRAPDGELGTGRGLVVDQTAVQALSFASPRAALGQTIWREKPLFGRRIIAVVPDFSFRSVAQPAMPAVFTDAPNSELDRAPQYYDQVHIRLSGRQIPETLEAIDRVWKTTGGVGPINRFFLDAHMQERYVGMLHEAEVFTLFAGIAIFLACLGLVGIAVSAAERRTKEIGIRKAAGATTPDIVGMLLWQFAQPVLWANILAWPLAWWVMNRWLSGFSAHVDLHLWLFVAASAAALAIALLTVAGQALLVARQKPVLALRYE